MPRDTLIIRDLPAAERPRERLAKDGPGALSTAELLAILLRTGTAKESAIALAQRLLAEFKTLRGIARASVEELSGISGLGLAKAAQLKAAFELGKRVADPGEVRPAVHSTAEAAALVMEKLRYEQKEHFRLLLLDTRNQVIAISDVSVGSLDRSIVHPREVFKEAIKRGAAKVIAVHNHPSGDPSPSEEDRAITRRLAEAGELIGIELVDHVVIGDGRYQSVKAK